MEVYHVLNRGVEKRDIVLNDDDRMRFVRGLYIFNDINNAPNSVSQPKQWESDLDRKCIVHIHAWCLMNNHYHILLSPIDDNIKMVSLFMKKLNMGYAKFFNEKYERSGYLWQGRYKKILMQRDSQFSYIPYYIHLNPLDYSHSEWRTGGVKNQLQAKHQLHNYRWSSYFDYNNKKNFPSILHTSLLRDVLGSREHQNKEIEKIISCNAFKHNNSQYIHFDNSVEIER
jgi:putative transposase